MITILLAIAIIIITGVIILLASGKTPNIRNKDIVTIKKKIKADISNDISEMDYDNYVLTYQERVKYLLILGSLLFALSYVYYQHIILSLLFTCTSVILIKYIKGILKNKCKKILLDQFKEGLYALNAALGVGRSLEEAFKDAVNEIDKDSNGYIYEEFKLIVHKVETNEPIENAIMNFARRSHVDDIMNFADILVTCKRTEGDVISIIKRTMSMITEKIDLRREIETQIAQKKFEQKIMMVMPACVIIFLSTTSKGMLEPMYSTFIGRVVMTLALIGNIICYFVSAKIIDIEV